MEAYIWLLSFGWLCCKLIGGVAIMALWFCDDLSHKLIPPWQLDYFHLQKIAERDGAFMAIITFFHGMLGMCSIGVALFMILSALDIFVTHTLPLITETEALLFTLSMLSAAIFWAFMYFLALIKKTNTP